MTKNIYEYKDASDWYVAEWGQSASYSEFERVPARPALKYHGYSLWLSLSLFDLLAGYFKARNGSKVGIVAATGSPSLG